MNLNLMASKIFIAFEWFLFKFTFSTLARKTNTFSNLCIVSVESTNIIALKI